MFQPLDGPSVQGRITGVGTTTPVEVKIGTTPLTDRQVITMQPDNNMKVYFGNGSVPSAATVLSDGFDHYKNSKESYEVGEKQTLYILAASGTINVIVAERA